MLAFMCTKHTLSGVGDVCENHTFFCTLLTFWPDCYYFHGEFWHSKVFMCTRLFVLGGGGSQRVYSLYTHENVDISG